ncbi:hypothetical protein BS78_04G102100 [Paspalum vaginatum]|nr:hypothetical protein BS78_04G102100 [Paspalum vaginatum]
MGDQSQSYSYSYLAGLNHHAMDLLSEVNDDGALLMELMEDFPSSDLPDGDADRLSHVIRSLEAEIGGGATAATTADAASVVVGAPPGEDGACRMMEDMLSDLGGDHQLGSFGYWTTEASLLAGHDADGWCVHVNGFEGGGVVLGCETGVVDHRYFCSEEDAGELMYSSPLWE